jgi:hypothetical protein
MPQLLLILIVGLTILWIVGKMSAGRPLSAGLVRQAAGGGLIFLGGFLALRGGIAAAAPFLALGLGLLGKSLPLADIFGLGKKSRGQKSRVHTRMLAMELDHDSGAMDGQVLEGEFRGRRLAELNKESLLRLLQACKGAGDQSSALLEAYLDRTVAGWRTDGGGQSRSSETAAGAMTREEAYAILGLKPGASADEVRAAHRNLMKLLHPDHGGSDYLAAKINQAKDLLLK